MEKQSLKVIQEKPLEEYKELERQVEKMLIASTHQFFAAVHERNRDTAAEEPIVTSSR